MTTAPRAACSRATTRSSASSRVSRIKSSSREDAQQGLVLLGIRRGGEALATRLAAEIERISGARAGARLSQHQSLSRRSRDARAAGLADSGGRVRDASSSSSTTCCTRAAPFAPRSTPSPISAARPRSASACSSIGVCASCRFRPTTSGAISPTTPQRAGKGRPVASSRGLRRGDDPGTRRCGYGVASSTWTISRAEELDQIFERTAQFERTPPGPLLARHRLRQHVLRREHAHVYVVQRRGAAPRRRRRESRSARSSASPPKAKRSRTRRSRWARSASPSSSSAITKPASRSASRSRSTATSSTPATARTRIPRKRCSTSTRSSKSSATSTDRTVAIVGDVAAQPRRALHHSRACSGSARRSYLVGPECFLPGGYAGNGVTDRARLRRRAAARRRDHPAAHSARALRRDADLRPRLRRTHIGSTSAGSALVRKDAIVMHPGPYNRGMELDDSVLEFAGLALRAAGSSRRRRPHGGARLPRQRARST